MQGILRKIMVLCVLFALVAPLAASAACNDSDCRAGAEDCSCVCHTVPILVAHDVSGLSARIMTGLVSLDVSCAVALLPSDIFRPPISR
jgi:hypothetical protein